MQATLLVMSDFTCWQLNKMTTIVGDWKRKILVSDSQFSDDDTGIKYFDEKVVPIDGGWLGIAGN